MELATLPHKADGPGQVPSPTGTPQTYESFMGLTFVFTFYLFWMTPNLVDSTPDIFLATIELPKNCIKIASNCQTLLDLYARYVLGNND